MRRPAKPMGNRPAKPSSHMGGIAKLASRKPSPVSRLLCPRPAVIPPALAVALPGSAPTPRSCASPVEPDSRCRSTAVVRGIAGAAGRPARTAATMAPRRQCVGTPVGSRTQTRLSRPPVTCSLPFTRNSDSEAGGDRTRANPVPNRQVRASSRAGRMRARRRRQPVRRHPFRRPAHEFALHRPRRGCRIRPARPMRRAPVVIASARAAPSPGGRAPR